MSLLCTSEITVDKINSLSDTINRYGFMIVFSTIILIIGVVLFAHWEKRVNAKSKLELELFKKERTATIEQNSQMFNLVTKVQTEQVSQLENMTNVLKDIGNTTISTDNKVSNMQTGLNKVHDNIVESGTRYESIKESVNEILDYVKTTSHNDNEILKKVTHLEEMLSSKTDNV